MQWQGMPPGHLCDGVWAIAWSICPAKGQRGAQSVCQLAFVSFSLVAVGHGLARPQQASAHHPAVSTAPEQASCTLANSFGACTARCACSHTKGVAASLHTTHRHTCSAPSLSHSRVRRSRWACEGAQRSRQQAQNLSMRTWAHLPPAFSSSFVSCCQSLTTFRLKDCWRPGLHTQLTARAAYLAQAVPGWASTFDTRLVAQQGRSTLRGINS